MSSIEVNGPAIREIRRSKRIEVQALADAIGKTRAYVCKIELGHSRRVSLTTLAALEAALGVEDRRALLAQPHGLAVTA